MIAGIQQKPVGIFWDIENCCVPKDKLPSDVIAHIRNFFVFNRLNHREYEFIISCDVTRLRRDIPEDINKAGGVTLAHVNGSSKNAADEKLRENMRKFVDTHASGLSPVLILISGDIDFVNDLRGYQTRLGCTVVLIHAANCSPQFKVGWNEIYCFKSLCSAVRHNPAFGSAGNSKPSPDKFILMVAGLPGKMDFKILKENLQFHANKVYGKVKYVKNGQAFITFKNEDNADRAVELFDGKQIFGKTLNVSFTKRIPFESQQTVGSDAFVVISKDDAAEEARKSEDKAAEKAVEDDSDTLEQRPSVGRTRLNFWRCFC